MLLDTQIISAYWKNRASVVDGYISSVTAKEFLETYDLNNTIIDKYYVPIFSGRHVDMLSIRHGGRVVRERKPSARHCDKIIIDFNGDYSTLVEHGSKSISLSINQPRQRNFYWATSFLTKSFRRRIRDRYKYMISKKVKCLTLNHEIIDAAMDLLHNFELKYSIKGNFRNSFNDFMILSTSVHHQMPLHTEDSLLARFAAQRFGGKIIEQRNEVVIDFDNEKTKNTKRKDSKGYIHRGWKIAVRKSTQIHS